MATEHEGDMSEISSLTDSSDEGKKVVEEVVEAVEEIDKPAYSDEDLETLVGFIRGMIILFDYEDDDFNEEVAETIKLWLTDVNNPLLFIFYDGNRLSASLAFPLCPINDLMYFMREPEQLFNVLERFHDDILFGTLHGDIEGSLLVQLEQVYGPMILSNVDWSENVKANVINGFNAFMTYLTELHYKLSGFTLLYVPREGSDMEVQEVVLNRSMIKRLEAVVIDWTGQIRATLSDTQHFVPDDLVCPSDEYSFWLYRHEVLTAIRLQYKGPNVQHIVRILELAQSLYIKHLKDVLEDLDKEIEIAESNIPFLKLLVDPCFAIGTLETADDFCSQLIYVMHIIRFIGQDSHYLNKDESITKLFLYLSNEIVACCMRGIDIDRILAGAPRYGIEVCRMKINCCESYKIIYEEMLEHFKGEFTWNLDYAAIFNRINAFLQRLHDILEICDAMLIFGKYAESTAYTSYRFFCNNAEEFERRCDQVEKIFHNALETIESVGSTILDINNKDWYRYIGEFREMLKSLDDIIENLLSNVFLMSENLEEKLNVLVTLLNFYKRENIRESFMRKIGEVWSMLNDEIMQLSKDVSAGITEYPALLPPHAGRYAVLKMRFDHLTHLRTLIVNCRFFPEYPQQEEVLALYEACEKQVKAALKGFSESWNKSITTDMASWYQRNLICRSHLRPGLFEVNIERRLLVLFDEAYYFKTLGVNVPISLDLEKHENTRLTFDNVLRLVLYFNGVVSSISDKERLFFKPMIQQTERKLEPLRSKLTWEEDLSEFIEGYVVNVRELLDLIELYKRENHKISTLVERIYTMIFVRLDQQHPVNMAQLMNSVAEQKKTVFTELLEVLTEVSKNIFTVYDSLGSNIRKMGTIWEQYLHKIDKLLKAAIFTCTLNTLRGVQTSLENAHSCPILMIEILLKKEGAVYEPSVEAVEQTLRRLPEEVCLTIRPVPSMARRYQLDNGERSFYLQLLEHPDYIQITRSIDETINDTVRLLRTYQSKWNVFRPFWCVDKAAFIERFKLTAMTSDAFQKNIEKFEELQNQLSTQGDFVVCRSVEIDALKLKYALTSHIGEWQTNYIEYLKCIAYGKIIDFNNILKQNIEELRHEPMEVYELKQLEQRYQTCFAELPEKEQEIALILKYFVVLEKYVADLLPEAYELRRNIDQIWAQYQADLKAIREQIENYQDQFKLSMTGAADALKVDALQMLKMLREEMPTSEDSTPDEAFEAIDRLMMQLEVLERREREIEERMRLLGVDYVRLPALREIRSKLENLRQVWILVKEWRIERDRIMAESYSTADEIELNVMSGHFRQTYAILAEGPIGNEAFDVFSRVGEEISHFCVTVTIVCTMRASFMQERHWLKVKEIARCGEANELPGELCSFHAMTELGLYNYEEELLDLCFAARKEHEVELDLQAVALQVRAIEFRIRQASGGAGFLELRNPGTHFTTLSDNIGIINRLRRSPHRHPYQSLIDYWEHTLGLIEEMLEIIVRMESECRTLHELHRITRSIARGSKMDHFNDGFRECFAEWCELMRYISSVRLVEDVCPVGQEFIAELESVRKRLNQQANALDDVLGEQREVFARFYLLSDSQLVRLISAPLNYTQLEQSLPMLYENVTRFHLLERGKQNAPGIGGVYTRDQEFVPFAEAPADPQREPDGVTEFMNVLECHIHGAMQDLLSSCHTALRRGYFRRVESGWLRSWPLQLCLKSAELQHTLHTRNALVQCSLLGNKKPLKMLRALHTKLLQELTASAGKLESQWQSKKLHDLLVLELNARDLIGRLCRRKELHGLVTFEWISQLHSYWHPTGRKCTVQLLNARFSYGYECKRSTDPMLLTPVSERARMATICALNFHQIPLLLSTSGGCGGRQVLLESLAHSLGAFLLTVECDENSRMEYLMRIVNGMKMVGGWLVFRCFERLPNSIVAQIGDHARETIITPRKPVTIKRKCIARERFQMFALTSSGCRITNRKMAEQLDRTLFRPVHFTTVDRVKVIESWLWLAGCDHSTRIAKLTEVFLRQVKLSSTKLVERGLFSLRKLKLLIENMQLVKRVTNVNNNNPDDVTVREWSAEKQAFCSTFVNTFTGCISDEEMEDCHRKLSLVFGGFDVPFRVTNQDLIDVVQTRCKALQLKLSDRMIDKVLLLHQSLLSTGRPILVTGTPGTGKSACIDIALAIPKPAYAVCRLIPNTLRKSTQPRVFDREWLDNLIQASLSSPSSGECIGRKCLIFDSVPCSEWIDCVAQLARPGHYMSNDFTPITTSGPDRDVKVIVECVGPLRTMTPSSVSHFALVHIGPDDLGWQELVDVWLEQKPQILLREQLQELVRKNMEPLLSFRRQECRTVAPIADVSLVRTFCQLCDSLLAPFDMSKVWRPETGEPMLQRWSEALVKVFFFCAVWSVGGSMDDEGARGRYDLLIREQHPEAGYPLKGNVYQFYVDLPEGTWRPWDTKLQLQLSQIPTGTVDGDSQGSTIYRSPYVRSPQTIAHEFLVKAMMGNGAPVLVASETAVGKTALVQTILSELDQERWASMRIALTQRTTQLQLRKRLRCHALKIMKTRLYPENRKRMVCFFDDLHTAPANPYAVDEFIRGFSVTSGWYESATPMCIEQCQTVLAMRLHQCHSPNPPVMQSLLNKCHLLVLTPPADEQLGQIFTDMILSTFGESPQQQTSVLRLLAPATVDFVRRLTRRLPPTPTRLRYQFSLQTIATIVRSVCHCLGAAGRDAYLAEKAQLLRLWIHECYRESWDRLERADHRKFYELLNETVSGHFEVTLHGLCPNNQSPIFTDMMRDGNPGKNPYEDVRDFNQLITHVEERWSEVSDDSTKTVIIHREAIQHATKVLRNVRLGLGGMVLMGQPGSGRTVVCQLAARLSPSKPITFHRLNVKARDPPEAIESEFSRLFQVCLGQPGTVQLVMVNLDDTVEAEPNERLMELLGGIIAGEELGVLFCENTLTEQQTHSNLGEGTKERVLSTMDSWQKVRTNLHFVLCLPLEVAAFRTMLQRYPSLARVLTVDCMHDWPEASLVEISQKYLLKNVPLDVHIQGADADSSVKKARRRESLVESTESRLQKSTHDLLFRIHYAIQTEAILPTAAKRNIIAPCSWYFELLDTFERVLRVKRLELQALHRKFRIGIERIEDATQKVANLSEELQQRQREIATFQEQLDEFLEEIDRQTREADEQTEEVSVKRVKIGAEEVVCKQLAEVAGADLQRAMPALNAAVAALDSLNKKDMNEIKSYSRPPTRVELVMEAVMILLGKEPTWAESKRQLGEQKFLDTLKGFDRNNITERTLKTIGGYVRNPDLEPDKVGTVSKAAKSLMLWVRAIENYGKVYKFVGPKIRKMEDANASLLEKQNELAAAERKLIELAEKLAQLRAEYDAKMAEKLLLEETARQMALKLERARNLVNNLAGECTRWLATKSELESTYARLIGDTLLAAGYLTYLGPVNIETRTNLLAQWLIDLEMHETPFTPKFSLTAYFYDPGVLIRWHENGLPPDDFSAENATILMKSTRVALIVDPQEEAQKWLIAELEGRVKLVDFDDEICESTLVEAFERHEPLMVENVNRRNVSELDELFTLRDTVATNCGKCRQKNQSSEMAHPLYLVGQEPLRMSGALVKRVNQLSFVLAAEGLEMKMLGLLVQSENPSLEERKELLQQTILQNKKTLVDLEEQILRILNESKIPLLEDEELYRVLESSRATFETVSSGLQQAEQTRLEIETSREVYRSCAARSALLFLVLGDLQLFNPLYRYSLDWYQALFLISLERSGRVQQVAERKRRIDDYHTFNVFRIVSRGLFENDRKLFAFYLCVRLLFAEEALSPREFRFLIFGAGKIDRQEQMENPCRSWLTDRHWDQLTDLDRLPGFHGIVESFAELPDDWRQWYLSSVPEVSPLPGSWEINLKQFQKYLIVRSLRLDRIENCMSDFTRDTLGAKYVNVPVGSLDDAYQESTSHTLVLLLLRGTSNPLAKLERLARKAHGSPTEEGEGKKCFETLAITEDRMEAFIGLLRRCIMDEAWLYVSDCHLSVAFLKQLPHVVAFLKRNNLNSKFRLWLSSKPHEALPLSVLQNCIKLTYEEPKGIKRHMGNLYDEIGEARFKKSTAAMKGSSTNAGTETHYKRLLFAMAFLHGLLLERNNFQQLGWIEPYQFVNNDFCLAESLVSYGLEKLLVKKAPDPRHQRGKGGRTKASSADVSLEDDFHGLDQGEDEQQHDATPWQFIKGAALELCYGAQIGSRWDRRIYETYLEDLFESRLLAPTTVAAPSPTPRGWFRMPRDGPYQTYVEFIGTQLPDRDGIDVFGQHENANIKYLKSRSDYMLQMLTRVAKDPAQHGSQQQQQQQPQQHAGQDHERTTQTISDLLSTLPVYLDYENALRIVGAGANRTSVADALLAEVRTYNAILARVRSDCHCLSRMLTGATNELLDEESDRWSVLLGALQLNKVPERWAKGGEAETSSRTVEIRVSLSDWVLQLRERVQYFRRWTETGQLPVEILLGRFTDPNRFLSGVLQLHAKAYGIPFEELRWDFTIYTTNKPLERIPIQDGFIARGLKLENGSWDWEKQTLTVPDILEMTCPMPPVAFRPVRRSGQSGEISERSPYYECPVFYSPERSEDAFILTLPLLVGEQQDAQAWAMFNTALLLND
ncbi:dynein heavy chain 2, axonemal-like [Anopheles stephensi]|uniref:dynein heavy chain 2, axonemal-like n=1 Tax=Anopheles stephensi TaxID=30069 RepID=UPI00165877D3|nr:dynein heavy chain 2, axonemal-like [Anopheles stephensi]